MEDHTYKLTTIVGTSREGSDAAIRSGIARANATLRNVRWFEVVATRGFIDRDGTVQFQVTMKVGFTLE